MTLLLAHMLNISISTIQSYFAIFKNAMIVFCGFGMVNDYLEVVAEWRNLTLSRRMTS